MSLHPKLSNDQMQGGEARALHLECGEWSSSPCYATSLAVLA